MVRVLALAGTTLLLAVATACGGGSSDRADAQAQTQQYCKSLRNAQQEFGALSSGDLTGANLDRIFNRMHTLSDQAPPAVHDEWRTLDGAITRMQSGLKDLGLTFKDLSNPRKLAQVDPQKLQKFGQKMQQIGGPRFERAGDVIQQHAKKRCGIKLGQQ